MFKFFLKNWKTSVSGIIVAFTGVAASLHWITAETATAIITIAGATGLVSAKDSNVTGGDKPQTKDAEAAQGSSNPDKPRGGG